MFKILSKLNVNQPHGQRGAFYHRWSSQLESPGSLLAPIRIALWVHLQADSRLAPAGPRASSVGIGHIWVHQQIQGAEVLD